ncbi:MAG TPA: DUF3800 domain-containing protein [Candidatus Brocadiaceae bacterium]|nr:DUF3800 domain-containing protein [Candidatus Brocadiaceae bacterium]
MLVFIDEAGDTGRKIEKGSSKLFVISLVMFDDYEEASACDQRINLLRRELNLPADYEFHFVHNSQRINTGDKMVIKKIKQQRSSSNDLLQVADYVAGVVNRKFQNKKDWQDYYRFVASKEIWVQKWPRENRTPPLTL